MGFRRGAYATVWSVEPVSDTMTKCRISIQRKDKQTGAYTDEFSGFVSFFGTANAGEASLLKERNRIKLGDVDVRSKYDKEKRITYYNFSVFSFDKLSDGSSGGGYNSTPDISSTLDDGDIDEDRLPF